MKLFKGKSLLTTSLLVGSVVLMFGSAFAVMMDTFTKDVTLTYGTVDITDEESSLWLEEANPDNNAYANSGANDTDTVNYGETFQLKGHIQNNSNVPVSAQVYITYPSDWKLGYDSSKLYEDFTSEDPNTGTKTTILGLTTVLKPYENVNVADLNITLKAPGDISQGDMGTSEQFHFEVVYGATGQ